MGSLPGYLFNVREYRFTDVIPLSSRVREFLSHRGRGGAVPRRTVKIALCV